MIRCPNCGRKTEGDYCHWCKHPTLKGKPAGQTKHYPITITAAIFCAATTFFILYLFSIRWHIELPVALFWLAVVLMLGIIVHQTSRRNLPSGHASVILFEIATANLAFHMIYQIPYFGLRGSDAYMDMASAKGIISSGFILGDPQYIVGTSYFPTIHILGTQLSFITDIELLQVVKWFPSLIDVALVLLLYLFIRNTFKEEKIALLSALLFTSLQHHILFSSLFVRETIALVLMVCCLYLYFSARYSKNPGAYYVLTVICLIGTTLSHHLTSFMLLAFLLIHFLIGKASEVGWLQRIYFGYDVAGGKINGIFLMAAFVAPLIYWTFVTMSPLYTVLTFLSELFTPGRWGAFTYGEAAGISATAIDTTRGYIIYYGFYFFTLLLGAILIYQLLLRKINLPIESYSFSLYLFFSGALGLIALYVIQHGIIPYPDRFLMFGWLLAFSALVAIILKGSKWFQRAGVFILVAFMLFNIYMIEPTAWDAKARGVPLATSEQDYALANTIDFSEGTIAAHQNSLMAIYDVHNNLGEKALGSDTNLSEFEWVIVPKEVLESEKEFHTRPTTQATYEMERLEEWGSIYRNRVYESNGFSVFKLR